MAVLLVGQGLLGRPRLRGGAPAWLRPAAPQGPSLGLAERNNDSCLDGGEEKASQGLLLFSLFLPVSFLDLSWGSWGGLLGGFWSLQVHRWMDRESFSVVRIWVRASLGQARPRADPSRTKKYRTHISSGRADLELWPLRWPPGSRKRTKEVKSVWTDRRRAQTEPPEPSSGRFRRKPAQKLGFGS